MAASSSRSPDYTSDVICRVAACSLSPGDEAQYNARRQSAGLLQGAPPKPVLKTMSHNRLASHHNSSQLQECLNPVRGVRDWQQRHGIVPVDHAKANRIAIKQQSLANRERKLGHVVDDVPSRSGRTPPHSSGQKSATCTPRSRPTSADGRDFVKENIANSNTPLQRRRSMPESTESGEKYLHKPNFGRIPAYLENIKLELAEKYAAEQAAKEAAMVPAGMRWLSEEERLEKLAILKDSKKELEGKMQALPFVAQTLSQVSYKNSLEARMQEIEQAIRVFSRTKVLVPKEESSAGPEESSEEDQEPLDADLSFERRTSRA